MFVSVFNYAADSATQIHAGSMLLSMLLSDTCSRTDMFGYLYIHLNHKSVGFFFLS